MHSQLQSSQIAEVLVSRDMDAMQGWLDGIGFGYETTTLHNI
jgi:hypothetical protein